MYSHIKYRVENFKRIGLRLLAISILVITWSCEDFVDVDPPITEVISETVYTSDETAIAAIRGIYAEMMVSSGFASGSANSITTIAGLSSDELLDFSGLIERTELVTNNLAPSNASAEGLWSNIYQTIYYTNSVIDGITNSNGLSEEIKNQLEGEARFMRAFCHFYLVNLYGDVPLITSTDFRVNTVAARTVQSDVYQQIVEDLQMAQELLEADYSFSNGERVQPNKFVATALLARTYLFSGEWENAEREATKLIENIALYSLEDDLNNVFLANSREAIWQLQPVIPGQNTWEARFFINPPGNIPTIQSLTEQLVNTFEVGDHRKLHWVDTVMADGTIFYHALKYKIDEDNEPVTEYSMVLRLAEQYLIRAEALAQQGNLMEAIADVDAIRNRSGLPLVGDTNPSINQSDLLLVIEQERRLELFTEWGHRWFDLNRTNRANAVLSALILKDWEPTDALYPIPLAEREVNSNLTQNDGY